MPLVALVTWIITALGGLFLLAIWLIEYDPDFQRAAATRLPVPVLASHVLLAVGGLAVWVSYLITDDDGLALAALLMLATVVLFGLTMAVRWVGVYRTGTVPVGNTVPVSVGSGVGAQSAGVQPGGAQTGGVQPGGAQPSGARPANIAVPPERHFPVSVVIAHGIFALATVVLVLLTVLGVGGS